ncbi:MAG TPA: ABC transporter ATP-binding protein [Firmicutes bacterium]|nr:ABC transporter ATP-binding protein [Bacillota bacterium]
MAVQERELPANEVLLEVKDLRTQFFTEQGVVKAVDGVSFTIKKGKVLGIVGESGCGKSITALSIMRLLPEPRGKIVSGTITFYPPEGGSVDITRLDRHSAEMRRIRGRHIAMIFQEPMTSLNPVHTIGDQIIEAIQLHQDVDKETARKRAIEVLNQVDIPHPERRINEYPHQMSGGQRQRAMIAMALSCYPSILIADEPTTALDVTIQAKILRNMRDLQRQYGMAIMLITHDLGVIGQMADEVLVMYVGRKVEQADVRELFLNPLHPYTQGLFRSIPLIGLKGKKLVPIAGSVPSPYNLPPGCYFAPRCPRAMDICRQEAPAEYEVEPGHFVSCWLYK